MTNAIRDWRFFVVAPLQDGILLWLTVIILCLEKSVYTNF